MNDQRLSEHQSWIRDMVHEYEAPLVRYARSIVGNHEAACDLVQETFLRLCRQNREAIADHEAAWLFRVCHNLALNHQRKERRMHASSDTSQIEVPNQATQNLADAEEHQMLWDCIDQLPENQQQVLRLKFHAGMKYRQIAAATGLSESNVGYLLHVALKSLKRRMISSET